MSKMKHVIIGTGPAGVTAAETIRSLDADAEITILTQEPHLPYSRILLPDYIAGKAPLRDLWLRRDTHYKETQIDFRLQTRVVAVRPEKREILTETDETITFDRLLIACGGKPKLPLIDGIDHVPVLTLKTLDDAEHILSAAQKGASVIVLARDLVGVEITRAFSQLGMVVTYIEWGDDLLPDILDPATAQELMENMRNAGVHLVIGDTVRTINSDGDAIFVRTDSKLFKADLLSAAIGKAPDLEWLHSSGLMLDNGIIADERLRTNFADIYVAGDVAEIFEPRTRKRKLLFGWKNAVEQGRLAGENMCGDMKKFEVTYAPGLKQIFGVDVRHRWK